MRTLFTIVLLLQMTLLHAQTTDSTRYTASRIITIDSMTAAELYSQTKMFAASNNEKFFMTNERIKDRKWVMGRAKWGNPLLKMPGLDYSDDVGKVVVGHCVFGYESSGEGCLRLLIVTADVTMSCRDGKVRILLSNYRYAHYNTLSPPTTLPIKANKTCEANGTLDDLVHCNACTIATTNAVNFVKAESEELINTYEKALRKYVAAAKEW